VTIRKLPATDVAHTLNRTFIDALRPTESSENSSQNNHRARQLLAGSFSYVDAPLQLGDLKGNRFGITLRRLRPHRGIDEKRNPEETRAQAEALLCSNVAAACEAAAASGGAFVNFFGLQRFGSGGISTASVGAAVLKNDWAKVIDLVRGLCMRKRWVISRNSCSPKLMYFSS
jgi:tRNA(Glu) U13 pseudouridine synthase TruD